MRVWLIAIVMTASCGPGSASSFWRGLVRATCKHNDGCGKVSADERIGACADRIYEDVIDPGGFSEFCEDYAPEVGRQCLEQVKDAYETCVPLDPSPQACQHICGPTTGISFVFESAGGETNATPVPSAAGMLD